MEKSVFERFGHVGLIKEIDGPVREIGGEQKAKLNRRGNELFNSGDVETARRIFQTTGYSDGLIRVGDAYHEAGRQVDALKMYFLAHERQKSEAAIQKIAALIQNFLSEEEPT